MLTGIAGEGKIHVIENHLASNDNEEDVIFDQVDFKGMGFRSVQIGTVPPRPHRGCQSFCCPRNGKTLRRVFLKSLKRNQWWI